MAIVLILPALMLLTLAAVAILGLDAPAPVEAEVVSVLRNEEFELAA